MKKSMDIIAGNLGVSWINIFSIIMIVIIMIPNIMYAIKNRGSRSPLYENKAIRIAEQIGRYASMFFMIFNIGFYELGFPSVEAFIIYAIGNFVLLIMYLIFWIPYYRNKTRWNGMALAIIPVCIFLLSGLTLRHYLLVISACIFGIAHLVITYQTHEKS